MLLGGVCCDVLPARRPRRVVSPLRQAKHHAAKLHLPHSVVYNIYMYGTILRPPMGLARQTLSRAVVLTVSAQLPMVTDVLLHAVANIRTRHNTALGYRRAQLHHIHMAREPLGVAAYATLLSMAMLGIIFELLHLAI